MWILVLQDHPTGAMSSTVRDPSCDASEGGAEEGVRSPTHNSGCRGSPSKAEADRNCEDSDSRQLQCLDGVRNGNVQGDMVPTPSSSKDSVTSSETLAASSSGNSLCLQGAGVSEDSGNCSGISENVRGECGNGSASEDSACARDIAHDGAREAGPSGDRGRESDCDDRSQRNLEDNASVVLQPDRVENAEASNNVAINANAEQNNAEASNNVNAALNDANIAEAQHDLAGPDRRQRRQHANAVILGRGSHQRRIALPPALVADWREIGNQWGLQDDNDIARLLIRHYEDVVEGRPPRPPPRPRCRECGEVLVALACDACGPSHHASRVDWDQRGSGGGKGGFCGRCRD